MANYSKKKANTPFTKRLMLLIGDKKNAEFERECGLTANSINRYLDGNLPKLDVLEKITDATGCPIEWLITGKTSNYFALIQLYFIELRYIDVTDLIIPPYDLIFAPFDNFYSTEDTKEKREEIKDIVALVVSASIKAIVNKLDDPWSYYKEHSNNNDKYLNFKSLAKFILKNMKIFSITKSYVNQTKKTISTILDEYIKYVHAVPPPSIHEGLSLMENSEAENTDDRKAIRRLEEQLRLESQYNEKLKNENYELKAKLEYISKTINES